MGKDLADAFVEARDIFEQVNDALKQDLTKIMWEGQDTELNLTENTQPALMAVSMAVVRVLKKQGGVRMDSDCSYIAGHSLGEYSALAASSAFELADTARLLRLRGRAMQRAVPVGQGAMAAILGLDFDTVTALAKENAATNTNGDSVCESANDNAPGQVVISGHTKAVESFVALASARGAKRAIMLPVSAPFHCHLMAPAAAEMAKALAQVTIRPPIQPEQMYQLNWHICKAVVEPLGVQMPNSVIRTSLAVLSPREQRKHLQSACQTALAACRACAVKHVKSEFA